MEILQKTAKTPQELYCGKDTFISAIRYSMRKICCGCKSSCITKDCVYIYRGACICRACNEKLDRVEAGILFYGDIVGDYTYSPFYYTNLYREIFLSFKFKSNFAYGHILGRLAADRLAQIEEFKKYDYVTPVPLSELRFNERGYNQSEIMAQYLARDIGLPINTVLKKIKDTIPQSRLSTAQRSKNIKGAFEVTENVVGKRILLYDDIHTTGSTLKECEKALLKAGAAEVCLITAAYVYNKRKK